MTRLVCFLALAALVAPATASASPITDAAGDFIPSYTGAKNGNLDVLSAEVGFNGIEYTLHATMNGPIGPTGLYVWGFNRGAGTAGFPTIAPGVLFDRVVVLNANGTGTVAGTPIPVTIDGNEIFATVPASLLPSTGFAPGAFTWNLWPRDGVTGGLAGISDFAPDNSNAAVTNPEPASLLVLTAAAGVLVVRTRRRAARV